MAALGSPRGSLVLVAVVAVLALIIRVARLQRAQRDAIAFDAPLDFRLETLNLSEASQ